MDKKLQKIYLTYNYLLIAHDLWQAHYQMLPIIRLKEFTEVNVNMDIMIKNMRLAELKIGIPTVFLNTKTLKMILIKSCCNKNQQKFSKKLKEQFFNTYKCCNHDNEFILLLRKDVYLYEYIDDQKKFSETLLPQKEDCYNHINLKHITDAD